MSDGSITSWTRLEPRGRDVDMSTGLSARTFDPIWFLTRQWQIGEFQAEDAGMPVLARVRATNAVLGRRFIGAIPANTRLDAPRYNPLAMPLEVEVERRPAAPTNNDASLLPLAAEAGLQFLRLVERQSLSTDYRARLTAAFTFERPPSDETGEAASFVRRMSGRAPDGRRLAAALRRHGATQFASDPALGIAQGDRAEVRQAAVEWLDWYEKFFLEPEREGKDYWVAPRLEYALSVATRLSEGLFDEVTLTALEYCDGHLDWSDFDLDGEVNMGTAGDRSFKTIESTAIPAPVSVPGAPAPRFWEIEEGGLAYSQVSAGPADLAPLMMVEYSSSYGNDWFVLPLDLPIGSVTRIDSLVVTDSFGVRTLQRAIGDRALPRSNWYMWHLDHIRRPGGARVDIPRSNLFFLPPCIAGVLDGHSLEQVHFMRDEMANLAWAIERTVESPLERPRLRDPDAGETHSDDPRVHDLPSYLLSSRVPGNWVPLLPAQLRDERGRIVQRLVRGALLQADGTGKMHEAQGRILNASAELILFDEEVPREGVSVERRRRLTRWIDGAIHLWTAHRKTVGRGEGSSGLRFDRIEP